MNKLKTLKDMKNFLINNNLFKPNDWDEIEEYNELLRQEAINRAKNYIETRDRYIKHSTDWYFWYGKVGAEMFAFNITEEELQNGK